MITTTSAVDTAFGAAYMKRLCRHFAHKIPTNVDGSTGTISFPFGTCYINVTDTQMIFRADVNDETDIDRAESVITDHLIRMANRDDPTVKWHRQTKAPG